MAIELTPWLMSLSDMVIEHGMSAVVGAGLTLLGGGGGWFTYRLKKLYALEGQLKELDQYKSWLIRSKLQITSTDAHEFWTCLQDLRDFLDSESSKSEVNVSNFDSKFKTFYKTRESRLKRSEEFMRMWFEFERSLRIFSALYIAHSNRSARDEAAFQRIKYRWCDIYEYLFGVIPIEYKIKLMDMNITDVAQEVSSKLKLEGQTSDQILIL
ncbi:hypothetical protein [Woodsholea maritima]|uniref:hypothetical protein n=1 Tax=Woodsholea maritima TaxID=240237 RepID=UPI00036A2640|nr:hypothetical protein [Woodsholea maritima]